MTTTPMLPPAAPALGSGRPASGLVPGAPVVPQVNLLPSEIRASRSLAKLKRLLSMVLVAVVAVGGIGYFWSTTEVDDAKGELSDAQAETARLLAAQAQYAEVPQVLAELDTARQARLLGTSTEVLWGPYLTSLNATLPPGTVFEEIVMTGSTPTTEAQAPTDAIVTPGVATLTFIGRSTRLPDTAAWIEALETIPNFSDASVSSAVITEEDTLGKLAVFYRVTGSVQVTDGALANRYAEQAVQE